MIEELMEDAVDCYNKKILNHVPEEPVYPGKLIRCQEKCECDPPHHGHPKFYGILEELADLHSRKNHDYASGGNPLGNFYRVANILSHYPGLKLSDPLVVALVYELKQLDAALWMLSNGHEAQVEGISERLKDVAVYSIIEMVIDWEKNNAKS
jgi:hypothetical protein